MSGVGKGVAAASIGKILQARGFAVNLVKVDPYLNVDAGTMNPTEHGEVFVLRCGLETDQDMGNYERFLNKDLDDRDYITSGMVYQRVIEKERSLAYGGKCVEAIPHIRDEITNRFTRAASENGSQISVIEIGGTIGDYQNIMFMEAARVMHVKHPDDVLFIMVSYLPIPGKLGEMKTRPTQNAVRQLNSYGIQPHMIIARSRAALDTKRKEKIAIMCSLSPEHIISAPDIESIYDVPVNFEKDKLGDQILDILKITSNGQSTDLKKWKQFVGNMRRAKKSLTIAVVGKYFDTGDFVLADSYLSVLEAIRFSAAKLGARPTVQWVNSKDFETNGKGGKSKKDVAELRVYDGIVVPGGFGETGIEGKLAVIAYAREKKIPYFGLCYGMQLALVEYARNVLGIQTANTAEIDAQARHRVIDIMPEQKNKIAAEDYGGTMRLGVYPAHLKRGTIAHRAYKTQKIEERHRHRYEVNPSYVERFTEGGMVFSGVSPDRMLMEIAELPREAHPFFLGTQFHPELQARPLAPHPLFTAFLKACLSHARR